MLVEADREKGILPTVAVDGELRSGLAASPGTLHALDCRPVGETHSAAAPQTVLCEWDRHILPLLHWEAAGAPAGTEFNTAVNTCLNGRETDIEKGGCIFQLSLAECKLMRGSYVA